MNTAPAASRMHTGDIVEIAKQLSLILKPGSEPSPSMSHYGHLALQSLAHSARDVVFSGEGESIATSAEATALLTYNVEIDLVAAAFPILSRIYPDRLLVNSESFTWLPADPKIRRYNMKPDMFLCHPAHFEARVLSKSPSPGVRYGVLANHRLCHDVWIIDAKVKMTLEALGEAMVHLHQVALYSEAPFARGILFSNSELWLLEVGRGGDLLRRICLKWSQVRVAPLRLPFEKYRLAKMLTLFSLLLMCLACSPARWAQFVTFSVPRPFRRVCCAGLVISWAFQSTWGPTRRHRFSAKAVRALCTRCATSVALGSLSSSVLARLRPTNCQASFLRFSRPCSGSFCLRGLVLYAWRRDSVLVTDSLFSCS